MVENVHGTLAKHTMRLVETKEHRNSTVTREDDGSAVSSWRGALAGHRGGPPPVDLEEHLKGKATACTIGWRSMVAAGRAWRGLAGAEEDGRDSCSMAFLEANEHWG